MASTGDPPPAVLATEATAAANDDEKSCFICLQTASETPNLVWVTPCPCSLDSHETCMLRWIAESEANQRATAGAERKRTRCPACNARIRTIEPNDRIVTLGDRITRLQRRAAPPMLATMIASMGIAASASYGYQALLMVAGEPMTSQWLFPSIITDATGKAAKAIVNGVTEGAGQQGVAAAAVQLSTYEMWSYHFAFVQKLTALSLVAPGLLFHRAVPSLANFLALPASAIYGAALLWRDRGHLSSLTLRQLWPPSPSWALVALPMVSVTYATAYVDLFGGLERRLNLTLRGRPTDEPEEGAEAQQLPQVEAQAGQDEVPPVQGQPMPQPDVAPGFLASVLRLSMAAIQLIGNDDDHDHEHEHDEDNHHGLDQNEAPAARIDAGRPGNAVAIELGLGINLVVEEVDEQAEGDEAEVGIAAADDGNGDEDDWVDEADEEEIQPPLRARDDNMHIFGGRRGGAMWDAPIDAIPPPGRLFGPHGLVEIADHAEPPPPQRAQAQWLELQAQPPPAPPPRQNGGAGIIFTEIITAITTRLLLPRMAASAGELLEAVLPKSWVMLPSLPVPVPSISVISDSDAIPALVEAAATTAVGECAASATKSVAAAVVPRRGLLQERWGRSLVGGLILIVLRDAWRLLLKYRRAQMKQQRRIRNVERRRNNNTTTTTSATNVAP
ncbi:hypothetical protein SEPCBS57363_006601 [Sporothrix epigloea]|uniref:RING-CH-type domain-containing protein n=1 Tax=Sporothrix epigloea TaxID=1892477 RepID=A0ABP0E755_9PEZI